MKKRIVSIIVIALLLVLLAPAAVHASGVAVTSNSAAVDFPAGITFKVSAQSDANITDIRLYYTVERLDFVNIVSEIYVSFTPARSVTAQWLLDMRMTGGFPPGTAVDYWWKVTDANGVSQQTAAQTARFDDGRYTWKSLKQGLVTLCWYQGDDAFGADLMDATQQALGRLSDNTGAELQSAVRIYIYATNSDLLGSMINPQEWTGGVAFSQYGVIAIGIGTDAASIAWGKSTIPHELTHLVVYQVTANPYNYLPTWLNEGLAMYAEGPLDPSFTTPLYNAAKNRTLLSVRNITSPFSAFTDVSILSYAESYQIVNYLIRQYGRDKMLQLLDSFAKGTGYDAALQQVYGFDMDGLNARWQTDFISSTGA